MKMENLDLKRLFKILLTIFFIVIGIKFFIYLLPVLLVIILVYMIYEQIKYGNIKKNYQKETTKKVNRKKTIEAEIVSEKED